ncbi:hypothetical protein THMIRHAS_08740 [Thiosulfatimonas sediminis]|uniref:Negative regulator of flagellin synthesis n=1 Tax=Thiosulfatimonas sediminis TaxID=2675054 RepID=A0A6F8PTP6_9GAMM|nr:flagellar biosynthesis anti-sigma factor FlgM [Thiosulfatimonas sediminis]BBP45501.1 hypothetical protein THMIRHAS_08740 [Thiosulfatimonas sediminis]
MDIKTINPQAVGGRNSDAGKPINGEKATDSNQSIAMSDTSNNSVDKVTLTDVQSQIRALEDKAKNVHADNSDRIAQLREAISSGSYQVDAQKVADKLMQTEVLFARF